MFVSGRKMRKAVASVQDSVQTAACEIKLMLKAQFAAERYRSIVVPEFGPETPFAFFSYYAPTQRVFNPGDAIQTLAVRHALESIGISRFSDVALIRDELSLYRGEPLRCVMQGWFSHGDLFWPSPAVRPVFVGTHFTLPTQAFLSGFFDYVPELRRSVEIGCRDLSTLEFCKKQSIRSYFSRCLTLTFPVRTCERSPERVFIVDVPEEYLQYIPIRLRRNAEIMTQRETVSDVASLAYSPEAQLVTGSKFLERYRQEAGLMITTAIHVAMPCIAMGIPVIFVEGPASRDPTRYSSLKGIVPINSFEDLRRGRVDFFPAVPDIEELKRDLLENLRLVIEGDAGESVDADRVAEIRARISGFQAGSFS